MKKYFVAGISIYLAVILPAALFSNQRITKAGVIDIQRVAETYIDKSKVYTDYENYKNGFNKKVQSIQEKINDLQGQRLTAKESGNEVQVLKLDNEILTEKEYLNEYYRLSKTELRQIIQKIAGSDEFYLKLKKAIAQVSEEEGFSIVLDVTANRILYWAEDIDITDKVIKALNKIFENK